MNGEKNKNVMSFNEFKQYISKNINILSIGAFILLLVYGRSLYVLNARVDTEALINDPHGVYNWLDIGRQGGVFTRLVFENLYFNPYFATLSSFAVVILSMIVLSYFFNYIGEVKSYISVGIFVIFLVHPIWVEQFYFTMMVLEISIALLLTVVSVFICYWAIINTNNLAKVLVLVPMVWAFSTYQLFMVLYIALCIIAFMIFYRRLSICEIKGEFDTSLSLKLILQLIMIFVCAVVINTIITKMFFNGGASYLTSQIKWGTSPVKDCIKSIGAHVIAVICGKGIFYSYAYIISFALMMSSLVYSLKKEKSNKLIFLYIFAGIGFQICPFLITIYGGAIPVYRAQFVLPFIIACNLGISVITFSQIKKVKTIIEVICFCIFIVHSQNVMRMQYTDDVRFQEDIRLGSQIQETIYEATKGVKKPIAFIGIKPAKLNASCVHGELIGKSIFAIDYDAPPHYLNSSSRITNLLGTMGFDLENVSEDKMIEARKIAADLPCWPNKESVYDAGNFVIVKLSDDNWYAEELMEAYSEKVEYNNIIFNNDKIRYSVDKISVKENFAIINGWMIRPNLSSDNSKVTVYIEDIKDNSILKVKTTVQIREDLNNAFKNEADYHRGGYSAKVDLADLHDDLSKYKIILKYEAADEELFADTNIYMNGEAKKYEE